MWSSNSYVCCSNTGYTGNTGSVEVARSRPIKVGEGSLVRNDYTGSGEVARAQPIKASRPPYGTRVGIFHGGFRTTFRARCLWGTQLSDGDPEICVGATHPAAWM